MRRSRRSNRCGSRWHAFYLLHGIRAGLLAPGRTVSGGIRPSTSVAASLCAGDAEREFLERRRDSLSA